MICAIAQEFGLQLKTHILMEDIMILKSITNEVPVLRWYNKVNNGKFKKMKTENIVKYMKTKKMTYIHHYMI